MIEVGDLVKVNWVMSQHWGKVLLVMQIFSDRGAALCTQGSQKIWLNITDLEKV